MLVFRVEGRSTWVIYMGNIEGRYMLLVYAYNIFGKDNLKLPWERLAAGILFQVLNHKN